LLLWLLLLLLLLLLLPFLLPPLLFLSQHRAEQRNKLPQPSPHVAASS
jgi:hypothetical protein